MRVCFMLKAVLASFASAWETADFAEPSAARSDSRPVSAASSSVCVMPRASAAFRRRRRRSARSTAASACTTLLLADATSAFATPCSAA